MKDREYHLKEVLYARARTNGYPSVGEDRVPKENMLGVLATLNDQGEIVIEGCRKKVTKFQYETPDSSSTMDFSFQQYIERHKSQVIVQKFERVRGKKSIFLQ